MDNHFFLTDEILWDYADHLLQPQEAQQVEAYLTQHPEWQSKLDAIRAEQRALHALPLEKPGAGFSDRVMAAWAAEQMKSFAATAPPHKRDWVLTIVGAAMGLLILAPIVAMVVTVLQSAPVNVNLPDYQLPTLNTGLLTHVFSSPIFQIALISIAAILMLNMIEKYLRQKTALQRLTKG
jgi:anti-sigma factor RsiW